MELAVLYDVHFLDRFCFSEHGNMVIGIVVNVMDKESRLELQACEQELEQSREQQLNEQIAGLRSEITELKQLIVKQGGHGTNNDAS